VSVAIFDLDNTLIGGDSDHRWGEFLIAQGVVDGAAFAAANDRFYADYLAGTLDIFAYQRFALAPLVGREPAELAQWHAAFMAQMIEPIILPRAVTLVERHRQAGDTLLIITATNRFITAPIAARFGIDHLIATEPECIDGRYSGELVGTPSFQQGKVERLTEWLREQQLALTDSWFYSDSHNDLPLLQQVDHPVAVDPDATLAAYAAKVGWPVVSLRD